MCFGQNCAEIKTEDLFSLTNTCPFSEGSIFRRASDPDFCDRSGNSHWFVCSRGFAVQSPRSPLVQLA